MDNFTVDGILCRVDRLVGVGHTGSAPFCYDGDVVVEPSNILQVFAEFENYWFTAKFEDTDNDIIKKFTKYLRRAIKKRKKKSERT